MNRTIALLALALALTAATSAQNLLVNGSFESGSAGWTYTGNLTLLPYPGHSPVGVNGNYCVTIGGGKVPNSILSQTFAVIPATNCLLSLATAAEAGGPGEIGALKVEIVGPGNSLLAAASYMDISPGPLLGTNGFVRRLLAFTTPAGVGSVTLRITDISPNGGENVDPAIDDVNVSLRTPTSANNLLVNGSFELPCLLSGYAHVPPAGVPGWGTSDDSFEVWTSGDLVPSAEGWQNVEILSHSQPAAIWQTVTTTPGRDYGLTFHHTPRPSVDSTLTVLINSEPIAVLVENGSALTSFRWQMFRTNFTATANLTVIAFSDASAGAAGTHIDNVALFPVVPYTYTTNNGTVTITGYTGSGGAVIIPSTINGLPVTTIGDLAFLDCTSLISVTIPNSVTTIGGYGAFFLCTSLTNVIIPNSVTSIGRDAFARCTSLMSATIGNSATSIGDGAFRSCTNLTSVTIGNSVTSIWSHAFQDCTSLSGVYFQRNTTSLGANVFDGASNATVYYLPGTTGWGPTFGGRPTVLWYPLVPYNYTAYNGTVTITGYTGSGGAVIIPSTINGLPVTSIAYKAFYFSTLLTSVTVPASVNSIGDGAFVACANLGSVKVDVLNPVYSSVDGVLFNKSQTTLIQCPAGKAGSYTVPNSVTNIRFLAFSSCTLLTSVTIPASVNSIGDGAFLACTSLKALSVNGANSLYSTVDGVLFNKNRTTLVQCPGGKAGSYTIPNGVTSIGEMAFFRCENLTSVTIPASVTRIGDNVFGVCHSLTGVYFLGNSPSVGSDVFELVNNATAYYLPGTTGWGGTFASRPTDLWYPESAQLLVRATGQGTVSPNYNNAVLKSGRTYSMTAAGANGHAFSRWIISTNWNGGVVATTPTLTFIMQPSLTVQAVFVDVVRPSVTITFPVTGQRVSNALVTVRGRATDNAQIAQVFCQINTSDWLIAAGTTNWSANLPLALGTNRVRVFAVDAADHVSPTNTVTFIHVATSQLSLVTNGLGRITRSFTGNTLEVGRGYTVTALPTSGQLFSNWTGTVTGTNNPLKFTMQSNMVLQANFVPNPYLALKGSYAGLFRPHPTETVSGTNAGSLALTLTERGTISGSLRLAGGALAFTGAFDVGRQATVRVSRTGKAPLWLTLGFDAQTITGQVSAVEWSADLLALRRATASSNAFAGRYSMLVMGEHGATNTPPGDSPLAVTVSAPSTVTVSGTMADGSAITLATGYSIEGTWPFYASLYGGRGLVIGWMSCATNPGPQEVLWVKPPDLAARYSAGFREERPVAVKRYLPPALKQTATSWTLGRLLIGGGNLAEPLEAEVLVTNNLIKRLSGSLSNLSLVITNSNGRFGGSFLHPVTRKTVALRGGLIQGLPWVAPADQVAVGGGWFLGTNQAGYLWIEPKKP